MAPCTHPGMKRLFSCRQKTTSVASLPRPCLITSREVNEARPPHACSRPCAFEEKKRKKKNAKNSALPKTHHESHSSPATATTSRRHVMKHVTRGRPHSPASIDPEFVEIGLVQPSQSVKTTNVTLTHTQTNYCLLYTSPSPRD